jgi:predicted ATPase/DNA-binding XRE family transcriptional regulator
MDANTSRAFGDLLRRLRVARELTQEGLAEAAGLSTRAISDLERGVNRTPRRDTLLLLEDALELSPSEREGFEQAGRRLLPAHDRTEGEGASPPPHTLPAPLTSFVGREAQVEQIQSTLLLPDVRLLTLTGPGGVGKTRLALRVVEGLAGRYHDSVFFVDLSAVVDPSLVPSEVARALGVAESGGRPLLDTLEEYLLGKQTLLVLDNFEQVVGAAIAVSRLLVAAPRLMVLTTSRVPLHLRGERECPVPPLPVPDLRHLPEPDALSRYAAVELFIARATAVWPDFAVTSENASVIAEICARLDGLPLAIELAAARVKVLAPGTLLERLGNRLGLLTGGARDLPERQQTIKSTIEWSHNLLGEDERTLFRRLGVFTGGWTLEATEAVCAPQGEPDLLDILSRLVDSSLVRQDEAALGASRFRMLETVREYAVEQLEESGEAEELCRRHAQYYLELAERPGMELPWRERSLWLARIESEHDNLRAALAWLLELGEAEEALRLAGACGWFWESRGYLSEGRGWLERALERRAGASPTARARANFWCGALASSQMDLGSAIGYFEEAAGLYREVGDRAGLGSALVCLGRVTYLAGKHQRGRELCEQGLALFRQWGGAPDIAFGLRTLASVTDDEVRARRLAEESLGMFRELGDEPAIAETLTRLAMIALEQGDDEGVDPLLVEAGEVFQRLGDRGGMMSVRGVQGQAALWRGDHQRAIESLREAVGLAREIGTNPAWWLISLGHALHGHGAREQAGEAFREALVLCRQVEGMKGMAALAAWNLATITMLEGDYGRAAALYREVLELAREEAGQGDTGLAGGLEGMAAIAGMGGDIRRAARLYGAAEALRERVDMPLRAADRPVYERFLTAARSGAGEGVWEEASEEGRGLSLEEAVEYALVESDAKRAELVPPECGQ